MGDFWGEPTLEQTIRHDYDNSGQFEVNQLKCQTFPGSSSSKSI